MVFIKPGLRKAGSVFCVIVMLEEDGAGGKGMIVKVAQEGVLENDTVFGCIQVAMDPVKASDALQGDVTPDHQTPSPMRNHLLHIPLQESLPSPSLAVLPPIRAKEIEFRLI